MYNDTITLFNRYPNRINGDKWYATVLHGVDVNTDRATLIKAMGENTNDTVSLHIKYKHNEHGIEIGNKQYILPKEYSRLSPEVVENYITFKNGKNFDFFIVGEWDGFTNEPVNDDSYTEGFYDYMNTQYDNVFAISTISGAYDLIKHFEITGK